MTIIYMLDYFGEYEPIFNLVILLISKIAFKLSTPLDIQTLPPLY